MAATKVGKVLLNGIEKERVVAFDTVLGRVDLLGGQGLTGWAVNSEFGEVTYTLKENAAL